MANLDKASVRDEVSRVKADFEKLCGEGKVSGEIKVIMNSLLMIVELLLSIFLERRTRKDNKNSSIPSSQTNKDESSLPHPGANGKRGKLAKSDAHNLWERLKKHEAAVLLFARDPHVAFTNNRAERDLRMSKVKQKVAGCFRMQQYAKAYCRISSYLQTMANLRAFVASFFTGKEGPP